MGRKRGEGRNSSSGLVTAPASPATCPRSTRGRRSPAPGRRRGTGADATRRPGSHTAAPRQYGRCAASGRHSCTRAVRADFDAAFSELESSEAWQPLEAGDRDSILRSTNLARREKPSLDSPAAILDTLERTSLSEWDDRTAALPERFTLALQEAARKLQPQSVRVRPPGASLKTEEDVDEHLQALRSKIMDHIEAGRPVIL